MPAYLHQPMTFSFLQPGSPPRRTYEAPTPGTGWASTPSAGYSDAGTPQDTAAYGNRSIMNVQLVFLTDILQ